MDKESIKKQFEDAKSSNSVLYIKSFNNNVPSWSNFIDNLNRMKIFHAIFFIFGENEKRIN
jgi:hypothetical protein